MSSITSEFDTTLVSNGSVEDGGIDVYQENLKLLLDLYSNLSSVTPAIARILWSSHNESNTMIPEFINKSTSFFDDLSSEDIQKLSSVRWLRIGGCSVAFVSFFCGILSAFVFCHKNLNSHISPLIISYNIGESFKALMYIINRTWIVVLNDKELSFSSAYTLYFLYFMSWVPDTTGRVDLILNALVTIDRFVALALPLKMIKKKLLSHPKIIVPLVVLSMLAFQFGTFLVIVIDLDLAKVSNETFGGNEIITLLGSSFPEGIAKYRLLYSLGACAFRYIPMVVGLVCNMLTIIAILYHRRNMDAIISKQRFSLVHAQQRQTNIMVVVSSLTFALLVSLKGTVRIVGILKPQFGKQYTYFVINELGLISDNMTAIAFISTYYKMSSAFRRSFWLRFGCGSNTDDQSSYSM